MKPTSTYSKYLFKPNLKKRIAACLIDYGLIFGFTFLYISAFGDIDSDGEKAVHGLMTLPIPMLWFIYFVLIEALSGATPGHMLFKLKVVTIDNRSEINFSQALKRHLLDPIDILLYGVPAIVVIKNSEFHQRLGDIWAKAIIVDTTDPEQYTSQSLTMKKKHSITYPVEMMNSRHS
ncbi:MAG: RDD family protein [Ferruginibacter sp.]